MNSSFFTFFAPLREAFCEQKRFAKFSPERRYSDGHLIKESHAKAQRTQREDKR
jgi:hypothetical protein